MNPKNKRYLVNEIVKQTSVDEEKVEAILTYYWRTIRNFLQAPTHDSIILNKLGTFILVPQFVTKYITDKMIYIDRMDKKIANGETLRDSQKIYYDRCKADIVWLNERKDDIKNKKSKLKIKKQIRDEYIKDKTEIVIPVEKQKIDTRGILELALSRWVDQESS